LSGANAKGQSISHTPWPTYDPALLVDSTLDLPVQINGKVRARVQFPADAADEVVFAATFAEPEVQKHLGGKEVKKKIYVKGRMINLVV
jgi:leucyl-tRNA synthetase